LLLWRRHFTLAVPGWLRIVAAFSPIHRGHGVFSAFLGGGVLVMVRVLGHRPLDVLESAVARVGSFGSANGQNQHGELGTNCELFIKMASYIYCAIVVIFLSSRNNKLLHVRGTFCHGTDGDQNLYFLK
jgi:hypothetical protein